MTVPASDSVLLDAARTVENLIVGPLATAVAVIAVAAIGFAMLTGRVDLRRAATVLLGCFILFGAPVIAAALIALTNGVTPPLPADRPSPVATALPSAPAPSSGPYDPYAGASVPQQR